MSDTKAGAGRVNPAVPKSAAVVIVGAGPVGLSAAIELGRRGVRCVLLEPRHTVSHARPRCKTINVRTMEHLRRWGIADLLRERAPIPVSWSQDVVFCTSLEGVELSRFTGVFGLAPDADRFPELGQQVPQYAVEELMREVVDDLPSCSLVTGTRVLEVQQTEDHANVTLEDEAGARLELLSEYVVGCDGGRGITRREIGSSYEGEHSARPNFNMVFRDPSLLSRVRHGRALHYWIINPQAPALMGPLDLTGTWWIIALGVGSERGAMEGRQIIQAAAGGRTAAEIVSTDPWTARMELVNHARNGRVFLAGDAAHLNPPWGGHGLNTGIGDAVDLGWKLAAVLDGWGGSSLLDSYEIERRPLQRQIIDAAAANMSVLSTELLHPELTDAGMGGDAARRRAHQQIQGSKGSEFHALDLVLGADLVGSPIIAGGGGQRLPHAWLSERHSIYDELSFGFTLLRVGGAGFDDERGVRGFELACQERAVPLRTVDLRAAGLRQRYEAELVLVRPDHHIAWRGGLPDDAGALVDRVRGASTPSSKSRVDAAGPGGGSGRLPISGRALVGNRVEGQD